MCSDTFLFERSAALRTCNKIFKIMLAQGKQTCTPSCTIHQNNKNIRLLFTTTFLSDTKLLRKAIVNHECILCKIE